MAQLDLTKGNITKTMLRFAFPMICGNLLQQLYNIVDTLVVGRFLGADALAAVGSSYSLMTFLTSILLGLCMGCGALFSIRFGVKNEALLKEEMFVSFALIAGLAVVLNMIVFVGIDPIMGLLSVPAEIYDLMREYLWVIFFGIIATFLYNYYSCLLRAVGNSLVPLLFLGASALLNIGLDLYFVLALKLGVVGAALATVIAQWLSGLGLMAYTLLFCPQLRVQKRHWIVRKETVRQIGKFSVLTCLQQSVMNLGILMVQGRVNSFGPVVMAAFAAGVKIDSFAYMPVQDFGNAFSTFIAQNYGAGETGRIRRGIRSGTVTALAFCVVSSAVVAGFAPALMGLFVPPEETEILAVGVEYLRIEGVCYCGIGCLFLLYGLYRAIGRPGLSLVLTVISLGTRVVLAYALAPLPAFGLKAIWWAIPIGWGLADLTGFLWYRFVVLRRGI